MSAETLTLLRSLTWVGGVLIALSLIAELLVQWPRIRVYAPVARNLRARVRGWWIMSGVLVLYVMAGPVGVLVLFAVISMGALREFLTLTTRTRDDHWAFVASFFLVLPVHYLAIGLGWYGFYAVFVPVYAFLLIPMIVVLRGRTDRFLSRVAETQWGLMVAVFSLSHLPALLFLGPGLDGASALLLMIFVVLVVQGGDLLQHAASVSVGRRPIAPAISPSRTWEGFVLGVLAAGALGAVLFWLTPFTMAGAWAMGSLAAACGGMGRLVMAAIKRDRDVTDWGHMNDGQGGFLDRLDSVIFASPMMFHLTRLFSGM